MIIYTTGTINQPDAGSVGLAMAEKIRDDVVAHAAWDLVEEFTAAAGTVRWYVFKCLASVSGLPNDFFVIMGRTLGSGELRWSFCESYTAAGHMMQFYPQSGGSGTIPFDSFGRRSDTFPLATAPFNAGSGTPRYMSWIPSGTSTKWWLTVDDDGFTVALNGASNGFLHVGAFIPLSEMENLLPLHLYGSSDPSYNYLARNPAVADTTDVAYALQAESSIILGFAGDLRYNDKLQNNQRPVAERAVTVYQYTSTGAPLTVGWVLGKIKRVRTGSLAAAGFAFGDAYSLSGRLWVPRDPASPQIWDTGVASA